MIHITNHQTAKFVCPKCKRSKIADISKYTNLDKKLKINVKCPCGYSFTTFLEQRKHYHKKTNLPGSFVHFIDGKSVGRGLITICDLSLIGLKFKVDYEYDFSLGDLLQIRFHLDDHRRTAMNKKVVIKNINMPFIGTAFSKTEKEDKTLAFYFHK